MQASQHSQRYLYHHHHHVHHSYPHNYECLHHHHHDHDHFPPQPSPDLLLYLSLGSLSVGEVLAHTAGLQQKPGSKLGQSLLGDISAIIQFRAQALLRTSEHF